jgi:hypothetical protein
MSRVKGWLMSSTTTAEWVLFTHEWRGGFGAKECGEPTDMVETKLNAVGKGARNESDTNRPRNAIRH